MFSFPPLHLQTLLKKLHLKMYATRLNAETRKTRPNTSQDECILSEILKNVIKGSVKKYLFLCY